MLILEFLYKGIFESKKYHLLIPLLKGIFFIATKELWITLNIPTVYKSNQSTVFDNLKILNSWYLFKYQGLKCWYKLHAFVIRQIHIIY